VDNLFAMKIKPESEVWLINQPQMNIISPLNLSPSFKKYYHVSSEYFTDLKINIGHYVSIYP